MTTSRTSFFRNNNCFLLGFQYIIIANEKRLYSLIAFVIDEKNHGYHPG